MKKILPASRGKWYEDIYTTEWKRGETILEENMET